MLKLYPALILAAFLLFGCGMFNSDDKDPVYTCNGAEYKPPYQTCEGGILKIKCGDDYYNPAMQFCSEQDNLVYDKCGGMDYNTEEQECENASVHNVVKIETFVDERDSATYKYVKIGTQAWMAENLNYSGSGRCYGEGYDIWDHEIGEYITLTDSEIQDNCAKYGRMYYWVVADRICPADWRLPSVDEWDVLINYAGGNSVAGMYLKATSGWHESGNGLDEHGFAALPGGNFYYYDGDHEFEYVGFIGSWWSSTSVRNSTLKAYVLRFDYDKDGMNWSDRHKDGMASVRCVMD